MIRENTVGDLPEIDSTAWVDPSAVIIGDVKIGRNVFVGPTAVIRADEPESTIVIGDDVNLQDRVVIHALGGTAVTVGARTSLAHGCIVHGPCDIGENCFIGFGTVVFESEVGDNVMIKHAAVVENAGIPPERVVDSGGLVRCDDDVARLRHVDNNDREFMANVVNANLELVEGYRNGHDG